MDVQVCHVVTTKGRVSAARVVSVLLLVLGLRFLGALFYHNLQYTYVSMAIVSSQSYGMAIGCCGEIIIMMMIVFRCYSTDVIVQQDSNNRERKETQEQGRTTSYSLSSHLRICQINWILPKKVLDGSLHSTINHLLIFCITSIFVPHINHRWSTSRWANCNSKGGMVVFVVVPRHRPNKSRRALANA